MIAACGSGEPDRPSYWRDRGSCIPRTRFEELKSLGDDIGARKREARDVAPRPRQGGGEAAANWTADKCDHDGNRVGCPAWAARPRDVIPNGPDVATIAFNRRGKVGSTPRVPFERKCDTTLRCAVRRRRMCTTPWGFGGRYG